MAVYYFSLSGPLMVSDLLPYFKEQLGADFTGYALSGHDALDAEGNTLLELFDDNNRVLYYVDPYAGHLPSIGKELTRKVALQNIQGIPLGDNRVALLKQGLEQLTSVTGTLYVKD